MLSLVRRSRFARPVSSLALAVVLGATSLPSLTLAQSADFKPQVGQPGKDVVWVPTPEALVDRMLTMAQVTPQDIVWDLGSGDGRTVIAAAKRGATAVGVEYNPDMVVLAQRNVQREGVGQRARIMRGDIFETNFSEATVVTLYLLPGLNMRLRPTLLNMRPGTRVVSHQFTMEDWQPDETSYMDFRPGYLWIIPAKIGGNWRLTMANGPQFDLEVEQTFQRIRGAILFGGQVKGGLREANLRGDQVSFNIVDQKGVMHEFAGRVANERMDGTVRVAGQTSAWSAVRR